MLAGHALGKQVTPNILFILADDIGVNQLTFTQEVEAGATLPHTPHLNKLAKEGILYTKAWASPLSSPTRGCILTGQYGSRTGVLSVGASLDTQSSSIARELKEQSNYATASIGKWHLSRARILPQDFGFDFFAGTIGGGVRQFMDASLFVGRERVENKGYITARLTNEALSWISSQKKPWFCWLSYHNAHTPHHLPPAHLHHQKGLTGTEDDIEQKSLSYYHASIEAMDTEIGRLLASIDQETRQHTIVIFMGDNGTEKRLLQSSQGKGSLYEAGIHVPLFISGAGVKRRGQKDNSLISAVDLFATIMELSGQKMPQYHDSYSFAGSIKNDISSTRRYAFAEIDSPRTGYSNALSDGRNKLITHKGGEEQFFDLRSEQGEQNTIPSKGKSAYNKLRTQRDKLTKGFPERVKKATPPRRGGMQRGQGRRGRPLS